jgi:hypothetical protein
LDGEYGDLLEEWRLELPTLEDETTRKVTRKEADEISKSALTLEAAIFAEAAGIHTFVTRDKRFEVRKLLEDVRSLMAPDVFEALPEIAKYDFGEAGRCIAFEAPTAAAFHLMRGTEDVLKWFYTSIVKRNRRQLMWASMVKHLGERRNGPPEILLTMLNSLRVNFRNPTQHPDKIYDVEEAQDLLVLSIDVVNRMVKYFHKK